MPRFISQFNLPMRPNGRFFNAATLIVGLIIFSALHAELPWRIYHQTPPQLRCPVGYQGIVSANSLPTEARKVMDLIHQGGPFAHPQDGKVFGNFEKVLPRQPRGYYKEYTVRTPGKKNRGARRLVVGDGVEYFYTDDHYRSFRCVTAG